MFDDEEILARAQNNFLNKFIQEKGNRHAVLCAAGLVPEAGSILVTLDVSVAGKDKKTIGYLFAINETYASEELLIAFMAFLDQREGLRAFKEWKSQAELNPGLSDLN